jgi:hypothetical protein
MNDIPIGDVVPDEDRKPKRFWFRGAELDGLTENSVAYNIIKQEGWDLFLVEIAYEEYLKLKNG